jgi:hypothetical protein
MIERHISRPPKHPWKPVEYRHVEKPSKAAKLGYSFHQMGEALREFGQALAGLRKQ